MTPLSLSYQWRRRLYGAIGVVSLFFLILFGLSFVESISLTPTVSVGLIVAIGAAITLISAILLFIFAKKVTSIIPTYALFFIASVVIAFQILQTGGLTSPFISLWALVAFTSAIFAVWGWLPFVISLGAYTAVLYIGAQSLASSSLVTLLLSALIPLAIGLFIWRNQDEVDESTKHVKNLASQLSEVANKSEIVINAIGDGVIAVDGKGIIQLINPAAQELLGWGKQDALMLQYSSILKLLDANNKEVDMANDPIMQVLNTNQQARSNSLTSITQSGKKTSLAMVASPIGSPGAGAIIVFRDVTKEQAEGREQAEFISTASHEMRTPVASIEGYLGLTLNPNTAQIDDRARDFIMKAHEAAQHLGRLFQDLLDVSRSEDGRMSNLPKIVDMTVYTGTITQGLMQKAQEKGLTLTFKPAADDGQKKILPVYYVNQDNDHIREIIDNLIENAIKYTPQGEVIVDVQGADDHVIVSVKDSGLGIPAEDLPHLFQKFYRVDNADRQDIGGTGLGLFLSRRLAESMQGRLRVESDYGHGSTFFLELPRVSGAEAGNIKAQQDAVAANAAIQAQAIAASAQAAPPTLNQVIAQGQQQQANGAPAAPMQAQAATTVPRGESLTREQIAERVRQLEALSREQQTASQVRETPAVTPNPRPIEPPAQGTA